MAIRGSLKEASLPDVLQLLSMGGKSGCLSVSHRSNFGYVYFDRGRISYASIVNRRDRLGDILVKSGLLDQAQIEEAVYFLFTWAQGTFSFEADVRPEEQDFLVSINPDALMLEGARRVDEWSLIEKKVPSFDIVFELDRRKLGQRDVTLTPDQELLVTLVDAKRDVAAL